MKYLFTDYLNITTFIVSTARGEYTFGKFLFNSILITADTINITTRNEQSSTCTSKDIFLNLHFDHHITIYTTFILIDKNL